MDNLKISPINAIDVQKVLASQNFTDAQKASYIKENHQQISQAMKATISKQEFASLMKNRPLIRFRPFKNSFTKKGDKVLLAKSLGIDEQEVENYIEKIVANNFDLKRDVTPENLEKVKTYVFRHGKVDEVVAFFDHELSEPKHTLEKLYKVLDDNVDGLAGYFSRPIHRMSNKTMKRLYRVVTDRLDAGVEQNYFEPTKRDISAQWALVKIYQIQNNSKLIRACRTYENLK